MEITSTEDGGLARFVVKGVVDEQGAEALKARFASLAPDRTREVVIDCREMTQIGSSGIGKLLLLYKRLAANNARLRVVNLQETIYELFRELKLDQLFPISRAE